MHALRQFLSRYEGSGRTTIAGVVVTEQAVVVFHIGDSRVYVLDDAGPFQLSTDDNEPPAPGQHRSSVVT